MKKRTHLLFSVFSVLILSSFFSCRQEDEEVVAPIVVEDTDQTLQNILITGWVYEVMREYYYWNDYVMPPNSYEQDPEDYFYSQLNEADLFSFMTNDYQGLMEEFSGVYTSMGYSPFFGRLSSTDEIFIAVEYVYPNSPAQRAGLQRGDIILAIDGQRLTEENYYDLYTQDQYTATLANYGEDSGFIVTDETLSLAAEVIVADPVLHKEVISTADKTVGYLVYAEFISGDNQAWLTSLDIALDEFAQAGVTDVVIDLRYNPGGEIEVAQYLASALAPTSAVSGEEVLVRYDYNEQLASSIIFYEGESSENVVSTFINTGHQLNLNQIYFLTSGSTASASELLISGLDPYMDVIVVGEPTLGKFYGSWVIPDLVEPARHNWAAMPIVLKYTNAVGASDFAEGLTPDYAMEDDLLYARPFGDPADPLLGTALSLISSEQSARTLIDRGHKPYTDLENPVKSQKSKLLLPNSQISTEGKTEFNF
ncbi:S41 family peptidase [Tunicatimonas pelagia]|uniref:S41 family peptidase n=1 Tax=Tunicatimonas pelagia TaxID=931531 RepID=UPI0026655A0A|nr:S41 family peptidase [Tunicatimonas pelagia]WKN42742.1 S41 family peptidase [Tunicatimonas pelagia]